MDLIFFSSDSDLVDTQQFSLGLKRRELAEVLTRLGTVDRETDRIPQEMKMFHHCGIC